MMRRDTILTDHDLGVTAEESDVDLLGRLRTS